MQVEPVVRRPSVVTSCADTLRKALVRGDLRPGERLPPERDLARDLGVNRTTLRAALNELARDGLLEARHGSGHVVRDLRVTGGPDLVPALVEVARESGELRAVCADLLRIRQALAVALVERIASARPDEAALGRIARAVDDLDDAVGTGASPESIAHADLAVVRAWVAAAGSTVLALFLQPIGRLLAELPELRAAVYASPEQNVVLWRAMHAAVSAGSLDPAATLQALEARDRDTLERL